MNCWQRFSAALLAAAMLLVGAARAHAEGEGQADLDEALRAKATAAGLRDLNQVIELLESALEKGLDVDNSDFAEQMLSEALFERASQLAAVISGVPADNLVDPRMQRIRELASSDLRRVIEYDNAPPQAAAMLAELLALPGGDKDEARRMLDEMIDAASFAELPVEDQAKTLALRASMQEDKDKALADFARAIELDPENPHYRLSRAQFYFQHDDIEAALAEVEDVVKKTPDQVAALLLQAQIFRALKKNDEALATLAKVAELAPGSIVPHQYRGEIYREMDQFDLAIAEFTRVLELQPGMDLALIRRAEAYFLAGRLDEALSDVDAVLKDNPQLAVAHGLRAQVLAGKDQLGEAIKEMKLLADELPGQADVHLHLALYYSLNDQPLEAIAAYGEVLQLDAEHFLALRSRGDAYLNIGEHMKAIEDFERALNVQGDDTGLLNNFAWVLATSPDDDVRDGKRAIELATKASELTDFKAPHILSTLAAAYAETGDFESASKWSQQAVDMNDPEHGEQLKQELASYQQDKPWRERQPPPQNSGQGDGGAVEESNETEEGAAADDESASDADADAAADEDEDDASAADGDGEESAVEGSDDDVEEEDAASDNASEASEESSEESANEESAEPAPGE